MRIKCLFGFHDLEGQESKLIAGYNVGLIDKVPHKRGSIYVQKCSHCNSPVLDYHPEIDYLWITHPENQSLTPVPE